MEYLSEDPTYLAGGLGILALLFLIALRTTQQGKFLVWAGVALLLALVVLLVERVWVTDAERIEWVVYDLRDAVAASDGDRLLANLTPNVSYAPGANASKYVPRGGMLAGAMTRTMIKSMLENCKFDFVKITQLRTQAGAQSRRGSAEFRILAGGSITQGGHQLNFGTTGSSWSLGFRETSPRVWLVERISPTEVPQGAEQVLPGVGSSGMRR